MKEQDQESLVLAENNIKQREAASPVKASRSLKPLFLTILAGAFAVVLLRVLLLASQPVEPVYTPMKADSISIINSAIQLERHAVETGSIPPAVEQAILTNPDISIVYNDDGSFTYIENEIVFRSEAGILTDSEVTP